MKQLTARIFLGVTSMLAAQAQTPSWQPDVTVQHIYTLRRVSSHFPLCRRSSKDCWRCNRWAVLGMRPLSPTPAPIKSEGATEVRERLGNIRGGINDLLDIDVQL